MRDFDGVTIVMRLGNAVNVDIVDEEEARDHIQNGTLRRDTMVTVYEGGNGVLQVAETVPCLRPLFDAVLGAGRSEITSAVPVQEVPKSVEPVLPVADDGLQTAADAPPDTEAASDSEAKSGPWTADAAIVDMTAAPRPCHSGRSRYCRQI